MPAPEFRVEFRGLEQFARDLDATAEEILSAAEAALFVEGEQTMSEAKRLVPVDEGILRSSGHVQLPTREGGLLSTVVEVVLGFGGPAGSGNSGETNEKDVGYAIYVHEDLTAHHTVGQAKFLETPIMARSRGFPDRIAERIRRRVA